MSFDLPACVELDLQAYPRLNTSHPPRPWSSPFSPDSNPASAKPGRAAIR
jgi:hypothetical protein